MQITQNLLGVFVSFYLYVTLSDLSKQNLIRWFRNPAYKRQRIWFFSCIQSINYPGEQTHQNKFYLPFIFPVRRNPSRSGSIGAEALDQTFHLHIRTYYRSIPGPSESNPHSSGSKTQEHPSQSIPCATSSDGRPIIMENSRMTKQFKKCPEP